MNFELQIHSPHARETSTVLQQTRQGPASEAVNTEDAYAGTSGGERSPTFTPALRLLQPDAAVERPSIAVASRGRLLAVAALATLGVVGALVAQTLTSHAAQPAGVSISAVTHHPGSSAALDGQNPATQNPATQPLFVYSDPGRPEPESGPVNLAVWETNASTAFQAVEKRDAEALLAISSKDGVWIRGLPGAPQTGGDLVHLTHDEFAKDLRHKGPFYSTVLEKRTNTRFVVAPDSQGLIQTILLD